MPPLSVTESSSVRVHSNDGTEGPGGFCDHVRRNRGPHRSRLVGFQIHDDRRTPCATGSLGGPPGLPMLMVPSDERGRASLSAKVTVVDGCLLYRLRVAMSRAGARNNPRAVPMSPTTTSADVTADPAAPSGPITQIPTAAAASIPVSFAPLPIAATR